MADTNSRSSPDDPAPGRLQLPVSHTGLLFRGPVASVYYHRQPPYISKNEHYTQAKVVLTFDSASGVVHRRSSDAWQVEQIAGRGVFWFSPNVKHAVRWECEAELIEIYYESQFLRDLSGGNATPAPERDTLSAAIDDPVIWDLTLAICGWCGDGKPTASVITEIGALIGKRLFLRGIESHATASGPRLAPELRRRLDEYIQANIAKRLNVPQLAKVVALSVSHFTALCRNTTGKPPTDYVRECRLWKARAMARTGNYRCREIARACGFYDGSHLNREFKKIFKHPLTLVMR